MVPVPDWLTPLLSPGAYWVGGLCSLVLLGWATLAPWRGAKADGATRPWISRMGYGGALLLALVALRWPTLLVDREFNPDESQTLAQAITLVRYPVFYEATFGGTAGPLLNYPLLLPRLLGWPINYATGRGVGWLLFVLGLVGFYAGLRRMGEEGAARLATSAALLAYALADHPDWLHYSSEHATLFLQGWLVYLLARWPSASRPAAPWVFWAMGCFLGCWPFSKLQSAPIGAAVGLWIIGTALLPRDQSWPTRLRRAGAALVGALTPLVVFSLHYGLAGVGRDFLVSYVGSNVQYTQQGATGWVRLANWMELLPVNSLVALAVALAIPAVLLLRAGYWTGASAAGLARWWRHRPLAQVWALTLAASGLAVLAPSRPFPHYALLLLFPLAWGCWWGWREWLGATEGALPRARLWGLALGALPFAVIWLTGWVFHGQALHPVLQTYPVQALARPVILEATLRQLQRPGDHLTVWGWYAHPHVATQLPQGTKSAIAEYLMPGDQPMNDRFRRFFQESYLRTFRERRPAFFVDAVAPWGFRFTDRTRYGHECLPELAREVARDYRLVLEEMGARLYVRRDRLDPSRHE